VLPKLITAPIWVIGMRRAQSWTRDRAAGYAPMLPLFRFAAAVVSSELLVAARLNLDKVIVGAVLGIEALGIYYFVFNAGLGFSLSLTSSVAASVYPHLAELAHKPRELMARYDGLLTRAVLPCAAIFALQAGLAFIYVPIVFGQKWAGFAHLVAILCASAISKPLYDSAAQLMRAIGQPRIEFYGSAFLTLASLAALAVGLQGGLEAGIAALALSTFLIQAGFAAVVRMRTGAMRTVPHVSSPQFTSSPASAGATP
jgi:O-antigen/teichoic acid export membrane protein